MLSNNIQTCMLCKVAADKLGGAWTEQTGRSGLWGRN